jgi:hypothetical protein
LTSPTPYDPPLTYGGWNQTKALGVRIAKLLSLRAQPSKHPEQPLGLPAAGGDAGAGSIKRRQRIIIHSSPFLRCLQSSIGISAGIAQQGSWFTRGTPLHSPQESERLGVSKSSHPVLNKERLSSITEPDDEDQEVNDPGNVLFGTFSGNPLLRVDSFLGEWLSPDYYEQITHPPDSALMLVSAKAELLVEEQVEIFEPSSGLVGHFPGGWSRSNESGETPSLSDPAPLSFELSGSILSSSPRHHRANSTSQVQGLSGSPTVSSPMSSAFVPSGGHYSPPAPTYALSPSGPIPRGYVTHARDACIDIDLQWDSAKEPLEWGDSGEYDEEWSSMHKRFRKGFNKMVSWYGDFSPTRDFDQSQESIDTADDDDHELILVLVTHSAGCNALVGAITGQPVLMDFGQASLTLVARKTSDRLELSRTRSAATQRRSSVESSKSEEYEIKILASTDHLRASVASRLPSNLTRNPRRAFTASGDGTASEFGIPKHHNSALGSSRPAVSVSSSHRGDSANFSGTTTLQPSQGLWSKPPVKTNLGGPSKTTEDLAEISSKEPIRTEPGGLWMSGTPTLPLRARENSPARELGLEREFGPKRRWTTNQADA